MHVVDGYLCSYPKSGRTWLRFLLACYLSDVHDLGVQVDLNNVFTIVPNAGRGHPAKSEQAFAHAGRIPLLVASHAMRRPDAALPTVLLLRGVKDVLTSRYMQQRFRRSVYDGSLVEFIAEHAAHVVEYLNWWAGELDQVLVLTYEQMHQDTPDVLLRAARHFGLIVDAAAAERAALAGRFDRMQRLEQDRGLGGAALRVREPQALRVRRGVVGGHADELDPAAWRTVDDELEQLSPAARRLLDEHGL